MVICVILEIKIPINKSPCSPSGIANKLGLVLHLCDCRLNRTGGTDQQKRRSPNVVAEKQPVGCSDCMLLGGVRLGS